MFKSAATASFIVAAASAHSAALPPGCDHEEVTVLVPAWMLALPRRVLAGSTADHSCVWFAPTFTVAPPLNATAANATSLVADAKVCVGVALVPLFESAVPSGAS